MSKTGAAGLVLFSLLFAGCGNAAVDEETAVRKEPYEKTEFLMGTYVTVRVYDEGKEFVLEEAFDRVEDLADKITVNEPGSEVDAVNAAAGVEAIQLSEDVYPLVRSAWDYSEASDGNFDLAIGPITELWHIGFEDARKPEQSEIDAALTLVDYERVVLDDSAQTVQLADAGMLLDLGAIAKGYITDQVKQLLVEEGVTTAIIDLGGNVYVLGGSPLREGESWNVGIQDPLAARGETIGKTKQKDRSIVTSGIYERYIEVDGVSYHHLMDPETGYPFDNDIAGVSIISDKSIDGDALSTLVFGLGMEAGLAYVNEREDIEAVFVTKDKNVYVSDGLADNFELTNDDYIWENE
ncbi:thiamine biosynthesis lipoprotein [Trichococcus patagoniensis]|uniref:FAD:protein FMN transferase n=2 Tax=Trichococcus patagoniensis TaxID=382641 RepID=A0A2T5IJD5_9LACT|nr:thiamine biosynthesis lipoprotein [Trichococcus patagoniensis]